MAALAACGGGGGSATPATPTSTTLTVTGTAATGLAIPGATVTGKCKVGTGTATTRADGSYTLTVTDGQLPCVLQITNPVDGIKLHTLVTGTGSTARANITPLTEMVTARVMRAEPNVFFATFDVAVAIQKITPLAVQSAQTDIGLVLTGTVDTTALGDFISAPLQAATQGNPTTGDEQDKLLDALKLKLTAAQISTVTTALASNQTTNAIKQTVISFATGSTTPPTASAGSTQSVVTGTTVTLDASASTVGSGSSLTYAWQLIAKPVGSAAVLSSSTSAKPTFVVDLAGSYVASVIVNDGKASSSGDTVTVTASVVNAAPVANAGIAQSVAGGSVVTLDASASSDANGDPLTYIWTLTAKPAGSTAVLSSSASVKPAFVADMAGSYIASVTVSDGKMSSIAAAVHVTVLPQYILIADVNFEKALIGAGLDTVIDGKILTASALGITKLAITREGYLPPEFYSADANGVRTIVPNAAVYGTGISNLIKSISGIENFINLTHLQIENQQVSTVDLRALSNLRVLSLWQEPITTIDLSKNLKLETLGLSETSLVSIDISMLTALREIAFQQDERETRPYTLLNGTTVTGFDNLNITNNVNLLRLYIYGNGLSSIDLSKNKLLQEFWANHNNFQSFDLSGFASLSYIILNNNNLNYLNLNGVNHNQVPYRLYTDGNPNLSAIHVTNTAVISALESARSAGIGVFTNSGTLQATSFVTP